MYTISQFPKLCGLIAKTLRHYDAEGMLKSPFRKAGNQYRYYSDEDLRTAQMVQYLRSLEFIIMEIKDILNNSRGGDLSYILWEKISRMEANIQKERELIRRVREHSFAQGEEYVENTYVINTATVAGQLIASIRLTGRYQDLNLYIPLPHKAIKGNTNDKHSSLYHDEECKEAADVELCIPVKKEIHHPLLTCGYLEKLHVLHTTHHGGYSTLWTAYKALFAYANDQGIRILTPSREGCVKGSGALFRGNPDAHVTETHLPFAREENRG